MPVNECACSTTDQVWPSRNVSYTIDGLSRVTRAYESDGVTAARDEQWTLTQTGNWDRRKLDLNGDADFTDSDEMDDCGTFNKANEWTARDTDCNASANYTLTYDEVGNLTDDGKDYEFVYDAFGRLRKIKNQSSTLIAEYTYNGLGYRIGWHYDVDADSDVDANDVWFHFVYATHGVAACASAAHFLLPPLHSLAILFGSSLGHPTMEGVLIVMRLVDRSGTSE